MAETEAAFANDQDDVGADLFEFLQQFFTLFPDQQKNDFYVAGESYAGKFQSTITILAKYEESTNSKLRNYEVNVAKNVPNMG